MKQLVRAAVQKTLSRLGVKLVNKSWGPRGFAATLRRAADQHGVVCRSVIDVGAARGEWTAECMEVLPDADYLLIDPLAENEPHLRVLTERKKKVRYWIGAAGAKTGELTLRVAGDQSSFYVGVWDKQQTRAVPIRTLDSFVTDGTIAAPDFIKVDVQGFEINVMQGATQCLKTAKLVLLETSFQKLYEGGAMVEEVVAFMKDHGFGVYDVCSYYAATTGGDLVQSDLIFAPRPSPVFDFKLP